MWLGIDFGTSLSSAAMMLGGSPTAVKVGATLTSLTSSAYMDEEGTLWVGQAADNQRQVDPARYRREFKRQLGTTTPFQMGNHARLPEQLIAEILRKLKEAADLQRGNGEKLTSAVITIPAKYQAHKRSIMYQAAQEAGFDEIELLEEPVAAALSYAWCKAVQNGVTASEVLLVYDLGGGTFDAALIQKEGAGYLSLAPPVGAQCGGVDFDLSLARCLRERCDSALRDLLDSQDERGHLARLILADECQKLKHRLSEEETVKTTIVLPDAPVKKIMVTRQEFNSLIAPTIKETCELCRQLVMSAGLALEHVSKVLLVGGSCRIPYIKQAVEEALKLPTMRVTDPELAVCFGAAIYGARLEKPKTPPEEETPPPPRAQTPKRRHHDLSVRVLDDPWENY